MIDLQADRNLHNLGSAARDYRCAGERGHSKRDRGSLPHWSLRATEAPVLLSSLTYKSSPTRGVVGFSMETPF